MIRNEILKKCISPAKKPPIVRALIEERKLFLNLTKKYEISKIMSL